MYPTKNDSFLFTCKENYFLGVHPLDVDVKFFQGYQILVEISKTYFSEGRYELFLNYLKEDKYFCNLWAAFLILELGDPGEAVAEQCRQILSGSQYLKHA